MPTFDHITGQIAEIALFAIDILFWVVTVVFFWGLIGYLNASGDEKKLTDSRYYMLYGVITFSIMLAVWGIVFILARTFGFVDVTFPGVPVFR